MNSRWGWFVMELPALLVFPVIYFLSPHHHFVGNIAVAMWIAHYGPTGRLYGRGSFLDAMVRCE